MVTFKPPPEGSNTEQFTAPCGGCIECLVRKARDWAIRCTLELREHQAAAWVTLTYDDAHLVRPHPELEATLCKPHLSGYLKRLRERVRHRAAVRFFGVGEYGDRTHRPHYHVILYGIPPDEKAIERSWPFGHVRADPVTPANIAYTAGYANKKIRPQYRGREWVDPDTGEVFEWQEPFRLCSRRPGIGGAARRFTASWRTTAIHQGNRVPVPRYLHDAWRKLATSDELAALEAERHALMLRLGINSAMEGRTRDKQREDRTLIALVKHQQQTERRTLS